MNTTTVTGRHLSPTDCAVAGSLNGNVLIQLTVFLPPVGEDLDAGADWADRLGQPDGRTLTGATRSCAC